MPASLKSSCATIALLASTATAWAPQTPKFASLQKQVERTAQQVTAAGIMAASLAFNPMNALAEVEAPSDSPTRIEKLVVQESGINFMCSCPVSETIVCSCDPESSDKATTVAEIKAAPKEEKMIEEKTLAKADEDTAQAKEVVDEPKLMAEAPKEEKKNEQVEQTAEAPKEEENTKLELVAEAPKEAKDNTAALETTEEASEPLLASESTSEMLAAGPAAEQTPESE